MGTAAQIDEFEYWAFISYSHRDKQWGDWLHRSLETYRVPKRLVGQPYRDGVRPSRLFPVFRDREELPVSADLSSRVHEALAKSRYLVVICSPNSAKSLWVNQEINFFKTLGRENRVFSLIVAGEPHASDPSNECFPDALVYQLGLDGSLLPAPSEPIAGDAREGKDGKLNAKLKLLAGLLDVNFDALKQRENERRRRVLATVTSSALVFAAAMSGVATYAVFQEREAKKQRKLALAQEQRANTARQSAEEILNYLLNQLSGKLEPIGHLDIVEDVQKQVETYYKNLGFTEGDLKAAYNWATLLQQEGDRLLAQGDLKGAKAKYQEKLEISLKLVKLDPTEATWQRSLSVAYESLGDVLKNQGDLDAAKVQYQHELENRRLLAKEDPSNYSRQRDLAVCYKRLGDILKEQGDLSGARLQYEQNFEITKALIKKDPNNTIWLNDMFIAYVMLGDVSSRQGDFKRAKTEYLNSLDVIQKAVELAPGDTRWRRNLAATHNRVGDVLKTLGDLDGAKVQYEKGLEITDRLAKQDPSNAGWQVDLFVSYDVLGALLLAEGKLGEAKEEGLTGRAIIEKLMKQDPRNADWQYCLYNSLEDLGDIYRAQKDFDNAFAEYQAALDVIEKLAARDPSNGDWIYALAVADEKLGDVLKDRNQLVNAKVEYQNALAILQSLAKKDSGNTDYQYHLSTIYKGLGEAEKGRDAMAAEQNFQASLGILTQLIQSHGENPTWKTDLDSVKKLVADSQP